MFARHTKSNCTFCLKFMACMWSGLWGRVGYIYNVLHLFRTLSRDMPFYRQPFREKWLFFDDTVFNLYYSMCSTVKCKLEMLIERSGIVFFFFFLPCLGFIISIDFIVQNRRQKKKRRFYQYSQWKLLNTALYL